MMSETKEEMVNKIITMVYWKSEKFWLGKLLEHPEIMSQGKTIEELEENLKDAYKLMMMDDVPSNYQLKEISVSNEMNY
jgi:predicted RNase H-like HicB family nuclease